MTRQDQERGRGAGIFRDLAPIAAAAGAAALTVTLVVGPTTAGLRSDTGETPQAPLALDATGRQAAPSGDIHVQVRPRKATAARGLTDVFDLVEGPESSADSPTSLTFVVAVRPPPAALVRAVDPDASLLPAADPVGTVPAPVATVPSPIALTPAELATADAPTKRPTKPLRPVKEPPTSGGDKASPVPSQKANDKASDNAETRTTRVEDRAAEKPTDPGKSSSNGPSDDKWVDKSRK